MISKVSSLLEGNNDVSPPGAKKNVRVWTTASSAPVWAEDAVLLLGQ